jgi:hypothetical protein
MAVFVMVQSKESRLRQIKIIILKVLYSAEMFVEGSC